MIKDVSNDVKSYKLCKRMFLMMLKVINYVKGCFYCEF